MLRNLTLEQAPPVSVPFRFFAVAPLFGIAAALLILTSGPELVVSRWTPSVLALTHLFTLGFMGFVMCGAMMQMLPVLGGAVVPHVLTVGAMVHILLLVGTISLTGGFLLNSSLLMVPAALLLAAGYGLFVAALLVALRQKHGVNRTIAAMRHALHALLVAVVLGVVLAAALSGLRIEIDLILLTNIHFSWGILGWVGLLVCGVAYQVVPMFQMTPHYPEWLTRSLVVGLFSGLLGWSVLAILAENIGGTPAALSTLVFVGGYGVFAAVTIRLQRQRRRRTKDVSGKFWLLGMVSVLAACVLWTIELAAGGAGVVPGLPLLVGVCLIPGFAVSVINGMLYRIVPFLIWFHLQHRQIASAPGVDFRVPNVKKIIPAGWMSWQFGFHLAALPLLALTAIWPDLFLYPAGATLAISFILLSRNLIASMMLYRRLSLALEEKVRPAA